MAYGADSVAVYRQSATFVDKILKGRKPADLPVELATKFRLVVNLKTTNPLRIKLSSSLLNRADGVMNSSGESPVGTSRHFAMTQQFGRFRSEQTMDPWNAFHGNDPTRVHDRSTGGHHRR